MNNISKFFTKMVRLSILSAFIFCSAIFSTQAEESETGYIADDLFIYMLAGPGKNYRILGTINAGAQIQTTGKSSGDYSEILDEKNRLTWIETKYLTKEPGLRFIVDDLKNKLANSNSYSTELDGKINELKSQIDILNQAKESLQNNLKQTQSQLKLTLTKVKDQDTDIKKQWFFNGAIVLGIGLILGLILPRFFARRKSSMDSWG